MAYKGHIKNGIVVLDEPAHLPDGTEVQVTPTAVLSVHARGAGFSDDAVTAFERENAAFEEIEATLRDTYNGSYIALCHGEVVDSDRDEGRLLDRLYSMPERGDYVLVRQVGEQPQLLDSPEEDWPR